MQSGRRGDSSLHKDCRGVRSLNPNTPYSTARRTICACNPCFHTREEASAEVSASSTPSRAHEAPGVHLLHGDEAELSGPTGLQAPEHTPAEETMPGHPGRGPGPATRRPFRRRTPETGQGHMS